MVVTSLCECVKKRVWLVVEKPNPKCGNDARFLRLAGSSESFQKALSPKVDAVSESQRVSLFKTKSCLAIVQEMLSHRELDHMLCLSGEALSRCQHAEDCKYEYSCPREETDL